MNGNTANGLADDHAAKTLLMKDEFGLNFKSASQATQSVVNGSRADKPHLFQSVANIIQKAKTSVVGKQKMDADETASLSTAASSADATDMIEGGGSFSERKRTLH